MLNNPNEWHNIEDEEVNQSVESDLQQESTLDEATESPQAAGLPQNQVKKILVAVLVFLVLLAVGLIKHAKETNKEAEGPKSQEEIGDYFYDQAKSGDGSTDVATVEIPTDTPDGVPSQTRIPGDPEGMPTITPASQEKDTVFVSIGGGGRENPFIPTAAKTSAGLGSDVSYPTIGFSLIEPPKASIPDPQAEELMQTTISGIMYDAKKPSAIVNINGKDQLVRVGDRLSGFTILNIFKDKVVVKSGTNVFRAYVGQSFTKEGVVQVANLQNKFGGAYSGKNVKSLRFDN